MSSMSSIRCRLRNGAAIVAAAALAASLSGCVAQPKASTTSEPGVSAQPSASAEPSGAPVATASPALSGPSIEWRLVQPASAPAVPASSSESGPPSGSGGTIEGWSGGYVDFVWDAHERVLRSWSSADGVAWHQGGELAAPPWADNFRAFDADNASYGNEYRDTCMFDVTQFQEGRGVLLVSGHLVCAVGCASGTITEITTWTSGDGGASWTYLDTGKAFGGVKAGRISGGSSGFTALGVGKTPTLWLSSDARSWRQGKLPADVLAPNSSPRDPVAFDGGYVLPGVVPGVGLIQPEGIHGCGADVRPDEVVPPSYQGAVWLSQDGSAWTRQTLPGVVSDSEAEMSVVAVDGHTLLAIEHTASSDGTNSRQLAWTSRDGKAWSLVRGTALDRFRVLAGRDRGLIAMGQALNYVDQNGQIVVLAQTGSLPAPSAQPVGVQFEPATQLVMGPAGVLAYDGRDLWIGVPRGI